MFQGIAAVEDVFDGFEIKFGDWKVRITRSGLIGPVLFVRVDPRHVRVIVSRQRILDFVWDVEI